MTKVILDCKIETPNICDAHINEIIDTELRKELDVFSNQLANKVAELIKKYNKIRIYNEGA